MQHAGTMLKEKEGQPGVGPVCLDLSTTDILNPLIFFFMGGYTVQLDTICDHRKLRGTLPVVPWRAKLPRLKTTPVLFLTLSQLS